MGSNMVNYLLWVSLLLAPTFSTAKEPSPFFFTKESFTYTAKTPEGSFKVVDRFSDFPELRGGAAASFRLAVLEASPQTFVLPSHWDADELLYVIEGKGVITQMPRGDKGLDKQEIKEGDVLWISAGTIVDLVNVDRERSLRAVLLLKTISSTTGDYREFFGAGGVEPESFLRAFSSEILGAAFNSRREEIERILGSQNKGSFIKATEEQIHSLSHGQGTRHSFPLLSQKPSFSNDHGQMYELAVCDYPYLRRLDVDVSIANISQGSMIAPSYNSKATKIAFVISGEGYAEMAQRGRQEQEKVSSKVSAGDVFLIPAGQPIATMAVSGEGLQVLCFGLNAEGNRRVFLAGENGVLKELEKEVKELSFGMPWKEVDWVLKAQRESVFMEGPKKMPRLYYKQ